METMTKLVNAYNGAVDKDKVLNYIVFNLIDKSVSQQEADNAELLTMKEANAIHERIFQQWTKFTIRVGIALSQIQLIKILVSMQDNIEASSAIYKPEEYDVMCNPHFNNISSQLNRRVPGVNTNSVS